MWKDPLGKWLKCPLFSMTGGTGQSFLKSVLGEASLHISPRAGTSLGFLNLCYFLAVPTRGSVAFAFCSCHSLPQWQRWISSVLWLFSWDAKNIGRKLVFSSALSLHRYSGGISEHLRGWPLFYCHGRTMTQAHATQKESPDSLHTESLHSPGLCGYICLKVSRGWWEWTHWPSSIYSCPLVWHGSLPCS